MSGFPGFENQALLATWVVGVMSAYGMEVAKGVAVDVAKDGVMGSAKRLWSWVKNRFASDPVLAGPIAELERQPDDAITKDYLASKLADRMKSDETLMEAIRPLIEELRGLAEAAGERIEVKMDMRNTGQGSKNVQVAGKNNVTNIG